MSKLESSRARGPINGWPSRRRDGDSFSDASKGADEEDDDDDEAEGEVRRGLRRDDWAGSILWICFWCRLRWPVDENRVPQDGQA